MCGTGTRWRRGAVVGVVQRVTHPFHQAFQHRHVDAAADTGLAAQHQGRKHTGVGIHASGDISDGAAGLGHLLLARPTRNREKAALALDQQVVGFLLLVRAALAVAGDVADDQLGKAFVQRLERQAHARGGARCQVLYQHVGTGQQAAEHLHRIVLLEVEGQAFLGAVGPDEMRGQAADPLVVATGKVTAAGAFDLDHPCAEVGELAGAERRGDGVLQADHGDAIQWSGLLCVVHVQIPDP